jgi:F-type H+-transporting ATPase subunit a
MLIRVAQHLLLSFVFTLGLVLNVHAENESAMDTATLQSAEEVAAKPEGSFNAGEMILDHISDSHEWHFFTLERSDGTEFHASVCLPVILYTRGEGLNMFSFHKLHHPQVYKGFSLNEQGQIFRPDGKIFYDFSFTKNVVQMLIAVTLMLLIFLSVARNYKKYGSGKAPRGLSSVVELIVIFIRDGVAKPMLGKRANKFLPYLLTLFFFIWINNMLGLIPGAANVTGNIAVTATLAAITFILMMVGSRKYFWSHIVAPPGVPIAVLPILIPIEFISNIIVKPVALMIRLFANMLAGHLIVLSFMAIIFIFAAKSIGAGIGASVFSVAFTIFIYMLELLVAALQAYIFTILSALFIGETGHVADHKESRH